MTQKLTVLIIEDEHTICDFMAKTLNAHDYKTITSHTGREGLAYLTSSLPDLVLLDLGLPDMDGIEIIKETRQWSSIPIIVISARNQEKEKVGALDIGADDAKKLLISLAYRYDRSKRMYIQEEKSLELKKKLSEVDVYDR